MAGTTLDFLLYLGLIGTPFICMVTAIGALNELQRSLESPTVGVSHVVGWFFFILALHRCCRNLFGHLVERREIIPPHSATSRKRNENVCLYQQHPY